MLAAACSSRRRRFIGSSWSSRVSSYFQSLSIVAAVAAVAKVAAVLSQLLLAAALWLMVALKVAAVDDVASKAEATLELSDPRMMQHDAVCSMTRR